MLRARLPVRDKLIERNGGRKFVTTLQVNVEQRGVEFVLGTSRSPRTAQTQETKNNPTQGQAQGMESSAAPQKEQRSNTWTNADGSIRPISKWSGVNFTEQQKADYTAGKAIKLENVTDKQGFHATMYIKFNLEKGRPYRYDTNPDSGVVLQIKIISRLFKESEQIIMATDAGCEGELIFRYCAHKTA